MMEVFIDTDLSKYFPLEKEKAPHSSILAWRIPWMEGLVGRSPWGRKESDTTEPLHFLSFVLSFLSKDFNS